MESLRQIAELLDPVQTRHLRHIPVLDVACVGGDVNRGTLFCCYDEFLEYGRWTEGTTQLDPAVRRGAAALVLSRPDPRFQLPQLVVDDVRKAAAVSAKMVYGAADESLKLVGVTGTNGKTTVTHLIAHLLHASGLKASSMGTVGVFVDGNRWADSVYTTPLAPVLFRTLRNLVRDGVEALAIEISSHALKLDRVFGLDVDTAVFTNLTRDHLDFHGDMADYAASKERLFTGMKPDGTAVINMDDPFGRSLVERAPCRTVTYGIDERADLRAANIRYHPGGTSLVLYWAGQSVEVNAGLIGAFNVYNILASVGGCLALGADLATLKEPLESFRPVSGRAELIALKDDRWGVVDYSHTPDSLEKILLTLREIATQRVITVFGCGGDRDRGKRPVMGEIATRLSDISVVTSDNPRTEDPLAIIQDILNGCSDRQVVVEPDRREAIRRAYELSRPGDLILVAGKGHETYQIIGTETHHFSDQEELLGL